MDICRKKVSNDMDEQQKLLNENGLEMIIDGPNAPLQLTESIATPKGDYTGVVLATLDGPVMDYVNPTRNVRLYEEELCDEIHDGEYVGELLSTKNALGEPDHPMRYQNRLDIHYPEVSHAWYNFRKVPEKGCYYATFDILDTPNGRILKTLIDYGVQLGVSSRGSGRTIIRDGRVVVDKKTYKFITFDIVCMPGNKVARLPATSELVSNNPATSLSEQVEQLLDSKDLDSLRSIKPVLNFLSENSDLGDLMSRIDEALSAGESDTITESATDDLLEAYAQIESLKKDLADRDSTIEVMRTESSRLEESLQQLQNTNSELQSQVDKSSSMIKVHLTRERDARRLLESTRIRLDEQVSICSSLQQELDGATRSASMNESLVNRLRVTVEDESEKSAQKLEAMQESLDQANADLESMTEQLHFNDQRYSKLLNEYFSVRCSQLGIDSKLLRTKLNENLATYSLEELEGAIQSAFKQKSRRVATSPLVESIHPTRVAGSISQPKPIRSSDPESDELRSMSNLVRAVRDQ